MPIYNVQINPQNSVQVEADSEEEARAKVELDIKATAARRAAVPYLDEIMFDYETGVRDKSIRRRLAIADSPLEREGTAEKIFGTDGFTYNSRGQLAVTPAGLVRIGEEPDYITLTDGSKLLLNRIVDEDSFNLTDGDLADFTGIAGPVLGAVFALTPQARVLSLISKLTKVFGNNTRRVNRVLASAIGTGGGKGAEELAEVEMGLQMQSEEEIRNLLFMETAFGAGAQGIGELLGMGYHLLLGKNAPFDNLRLYRQATQGRNLDDVMKLDLKLGREATEKEINQAVKDGIIKVYAEKGLPSQGAFNRSLPGRAQSLAEQVLGNTRVEESKKYLLRSMTELFARLNKESVDGQSLTSLLKRYQGKTAMSPEQKGLLDKSVSAQLAKVKTSEVETIQSIEKLFEDVMEDFTLMGINRSPITLGKVGEEIRDALQKAKAGVDKNLADKYRIVDLELRSLKEGVVNKQIGEQIVRPRLDNARKIIDDYVNTNYAARINIGDAVDVNSDPVAYLRAIIQRMDDGVENIGMEGGRDFTLVGLRNALSTLKEERRLTMSDSFLTKITDDVIKELQGIFDDMADPTILKRSAPNLNALETQKIARAADLLQDANLSAQKYLAPFDNAKLMKIKAEGKYGAYDPLEIYESAVLNGKTRDLRDIFQAVRNYDDYIKATAPTGLKAVNELQLRNNLKQKLISDAFQDSFDAATDTVDFAKFTTYLKNFDKKSPGKLRELFANEALGSENFLRVLNQVNELKPNLKPAEITKLIAQFTKSKVPGGLTETATGKAFLEGLKELAEAKSKTASFEGNLIIRKLPEATTEEVVSKIFTPQGASNIRLIRETVGEESFKEIQNNAMNKILQRAIDFDGMTKKGDITKIFQAEKFNNILRSYGDETLEAMFGKDVAIGLKNYGKTIDVMTAGEVGRGGSAGTLIAAAIAINAFNPALWPTIFGLAVLRSAFQTPFILKMMARTDKSAGVQLVEIFERMFRLYGLTEIGRGVAEVSETAREELDKNIQTLNQNEVDDDQLQSIINQAKKSVRSPSTIQLPTVKPLTTNLNQGSLSNDPSVRAAILTGGQSIV